MKITDKYILPVWVLLVLASCKDPYNPVIKNLDKEILVVEGFVDGADETVITLSRARSMGSVDTGYQKFVTDAYVSIEDDQENVYPLMSTHTGDYVGAYTLNPLLRYRVRIRLSNLKEYASAFVPYKISPPIDSVNYRIVPGGARFFVSTHDDTGNSVFYRWKYSEAWEFHSYYHTEYIFDPNQNKVVEFEDSVYNCWQFDQSTDILINSTEKLTQDVVNESPLLFIENGDFKLSYLYSINVKQYVMDSLAYNYYRQLKKNTEETGGIFDPQPGNLRGNLVNLNDSSDIVVGYISAGSSYQTRQFFRVRWNFFEDCSDIVYVPNNADSIDAYLNRGGYWPIGKQDEATGVVWPSAKNSCVDCTERGTNIKPAYWP